MKGAACYEISCFLMGMMQRSLKEKRMMGEPCTVMSLAIKLNGDVGLHLYFDLFMFITKICRYLHTYISSFNF